MSAQNILETLRNDGVVVYIDSSGKLRGKGPVQDRHRQIVAQHREELILLITNQNEPPSLRNVLVQAGWDSEMVELIFWTMTNAVPTEFKLLNGQCVKNKRWFYQVLNREIDAGPQGKYALNGWLKWILVYLKNYQI